MLLSHMCTCSCTGPIFIHRNAFAIDRSQAQVPSSLPSVTNEPVWLPTRFSEIRQHVDLQSRHELHCGGSQLDATVLPDIDCFTPAVPDDAAESRRPCSKGLQALHRKHSQEWGEGRRPCSKGLQALHRKYSQEWGERRTCMTTMSSESMMVLRRWATMKLVLSALRPSSASCIRRSVNVSSDDVACPQSQQPSATREHATHALRGDSYKTCAADTSAGANTRHTANVSCRRSKFHRRR